MKKGSSAWLLIGAMVLAGAGGVVYWQTRKPPPPRYVTQPVKRGDVVQVVNATGLLQPVVLSPVGSQVSGIVWKLRADFNDRVKKDQVLLELDPAIFDAAVRQQEANLASAKADVTKAEAALTDASLIARRSISLAEKHYIPDADRDTAVAKQHEAEGDLAGSRARVKQAEASLQNARLNLKNSVILSPVDGMVISRNVELGQAVAAAFQAPNLFTIAQDLKQMQVLANVDEADIGMVQVAQGAAFTVDAFRSRHFEAKVSQVRNAAQTVQNVVTYVVVLDVDNTDLLLKPGMTANVKIEVARREEVLLLPNAALRFKPPVEPLKGAKGDRAKGDHAKGDRKKGDGGLGSGKDPFVSKSTVHVLEGAGELKPVPVVTGITDGNVTELISGPGEGTEVVTDMARTAEKSGASPMGPRPGGPQGGPRRGI